ncbi:MAG: hypothetical protein Q8P45_01890 [Candidatus Harrisonbacteria bacterium]|nr:hypothetical protein [Candidatus Harrisonbacteria bacterium]
MKHMKDSRSKIVILVLSALIVLIPVVSLALIYLGDVEIPQKFANSRQIAVETATRLNGEINSSIESIEVIARYEREGNFQDALELANTELEKSGLREQLAASLAVQMEIMAQELVNIDSAKAREKALEAVSAQVAAVSRIIPYNKLFERLIELLQRKFAGENVPDNVISTTIENLNTDAQEINKLTEQFIKSINSFDALLRI